MEPPEKPVLAVLSPLPVSALKRNFCSRMRLAAVCSCVEVTPELVFSMELKSQFQGNSMSRPAAMVVAARLALGLPLLPPGMAHQSVITKPLNPKSVRKISVSRCAFWVQLVPLTLLNAAITQATPPSLMIISKWRA